MNSEILDNIAQVALFILFLYSVVYWVVQILLMLVSVRSAVKSRRRRETGSLQRLFGNPFTPPVSVVVPAHNEEAGVVMSVRAMLALHYPGLQVVVVDDGSTDDTFARLAEEFNLVEVPWVPRTDIGVLGPILSVHAPSGDDPLIVVRKDSIGVKADALNAGITVASAPLVCCVDGDSLLDQEALLAAVRPFVEDPSRTVASGGAIRVVNDSTVYRGRVTQVRMPKSALARMQAAEYLRAFTITRVGLAAFQGLIMLSGAFSLLRKDAVAAAGGMRTDTLAEDAEIVLRLHRLCRKAELPYRVEMEGDAICWTEVPDTVKVLRRQRIRWAQGLAELLWTSRDMFLRPKYGRLGWVVLPFYFAYELMAPFVVAFGLIALGYGWWVGLFTWLYVLVFLLVLLVMSWSGTIVALLVDEIAWTPYTTQGQLARSVGAGLRQGAGYVQLVSWWRFRGLIRAIFGRGGSWGEMTRTGFTEEEPVLEQNP